jgi:hypothetical protein
MVGRVCGQILTLIANRVRTPKQGARSGNARAYDVPANVVLLGNFINFGMGPKPDTHGTLAITLPIGDAPLRGIAAGDVGGCAYGILAAGGDLIGASVGIAGGHLTGKEMAAGLSTALCKEVRYGAVSPAVYRAFGFSGTEDLGNMFQFNAEFAGEYCAARDIDATRRLNPDLRTFDSWLKTEATAIPLSK